jgi:hypothetical protein
MTENLSTQPRKICVKPYCVEGLWIRETKDIGVPQDIMWLDWGGGGGELASNLSMKEGSLFCFIRLSH